MVCRMGEEQKICVVRQNIWVARQKIVLVGHRNKMLPRNPLHFISAFPIRMGEFQKQQIKLGLIISAMIQPF